jgi:acetylglutamate kinase
MKMVIAIPGAVIRNGEHRQKFVEIIVQFVQDGHWIIVAQGDEGATENGGIRTQQHVSYRNAQSANGAGGAGVSAFDSIANTGRLLAAHLAVVKVCGLAMIASDADLCRLRKHPPTASGNGGIEICSMNTRWLDITCSNKGVPIISNIALSAWGELYSLGLDHLTAECAIHWKTDALTFLTDEDGVIDHDGDVIRWFNVNDMERLSAARHEKSMVARLKACKQALEGGVHRVRMIPISAMEHLSSFYFTKIDYGTEVISASKRRGIRAMPQAAESFSREHR